MKFTFTFVSLALIVSSAESFAGTYENKKFLAEVVKEIKKECTGKSGIEYINCKADLSPEKCEALVWSRDTKAWQRCVYSCGSESIFSRTVGECS